MYVQCTHDALHLAPTLQLSMPMTRGLQAIIAWAQLRWSTKVNFVCAFSFSVWDLIPWFCHNVIDYNCDQILRYPCGLHRWFVHKNRACNRYFRMWTVPMPDWNVRNDAVRINTVSSIYLWCIITIGTAAFEFDPHFHDHNIWKTEFWWIHFSKNHYSSSYADQILNFEHMHRSNQYRTAIKFLARELAGHCRLSWITRVRFLQKLYISHHFAVFSHFQCPCPTIMIAWIPTTALHISHTTTTTHHQPLHTKRTMATHPMILVF